MIFDVIKDAMVYSMGDKETILKVGLLFMISTLLVPVLLILIHKNVMFTRRKGRASLCGLCEK